jgi:hypothetical protein
MASKYAALPGLVRAPVRSAVQRLPVSVHGRGLRYARWAKRFLTFAELPEEPRFRRSYTLYDPPELVGLISPDLAGYVGDVIWEHRDVYKDNSLTDEVNRMCLADARMFLRGLNPPTRTGRAGGVPMPVGSHPVICAGRRSRPGRRRRSAAPGRGRAQAGRGGGWKLPRGSCHPTEAP